MLDAALDSIVSMDAKGLVTDWNAAAERMFGWSREEALGREMAELIIPPALRDAHRRGLARYLLTQQSNILNRRVELTGRRKDGSEFPVELTIARIAGDGPPAFTGYLRDLTERKRAEAESREREAFRERFIGILGHDLRSPLQGILGSAGQLKHRLVSEEDRRSAGRISSSAKRMSRMIDELLDLTRGRMGGGIPVHPRPTDAAQTCQQVVEETRAAWPARNILLEVQGDVTGQFDPDRLAQLLSNLTVNALVHGAPDRPVLVSAAAKGERVALEVHNEGSPIPESDRELIFDPFRIGAGGAPTGLGLGLYIAREIARAHGGELEVESSAERGTTFRAVLPRSR
jgi:PAS domain S-box-containing protein